MGKKDLHLTMHIFVCTSLFHFDKRIQVLCMQKIISHVYWPTLTYFPAWYTSKSIVTKLSLKDEPSSVKIGENIWALKEVGGRIACIMSDYLLYIEKDEGLFCMKVVATHYDTWCVLLCIFYWYFISYLATLNKTMWKILHDSPLVFPVS